MSRLLLFTATRSNCFLQLLSVPDPAKRKHRMMCTIHQPVMALPMWRRKRSGMVIATMSTIPLLIG